MKTTAVRLSLLATTQALSLKIDVADFLSGTVKQQDTLLLTETATSSPSEVAGESDQATSQLVAKDLDINVDGLSSTSGILTQISSEASRDDFLDELFKPDRFVKSLC